MATPCVRRHPAPAGLTRGARTRSPLRIPRPQAPRPRACARSRPLCNWQDPCGWPPIDRLAPQGRAVCVPARAGVAGQPAPAGRGDPRPADAGSGSVRIEAATLMFLQLDTRGLLRTRATPLTMDQTGRLRGARPCRSATSEGDRRVPARVNLGRGHAGQTVTVAVQKPPSASTSVTATPGSCPAPPPCPCVGSRPSGSGTPRPNPCCHPYAGNASAAEERTNVS